MTPSLVDVTLTRTSETTSSSVGRSSTPSSANAVSSPSTTPRTSSHDTPTPLSKAEAVSPAGCGGHTTGPLASLGLCDGDIEGEADPGGDSDGDGDAEADTDGDSEGDADGDTDGDADGEALSDGLGAGAVVEADADESTDGLADAGSDTTDASGVADRSVPVRELSVTDGSRSGEALSAGTVSSVADALGSGVASLLEPSGLGELVGIVVGDGLGLGSNDGLSDEVGAGDEGVSSPDSTGVGATTSHNSRIGSASLPVLTVTSAAPWETPPRIRAQASARTVPPWNQRLTNAR